MYVIRGGVYVSGRFVFRAVGTNRDLDFVKTPLGRTPSSYGSLGPRSYSVGG